MNVAGKSQVLDPAGADIVGVNVPFGEFLNAGSFETTYMDDRIRISRSKVGIVDQLRVFLKSELQATADVKEIKAVQDDIQDVDAVVDKEWTEADDVSVEGDDVDDVSPSDY